MSNNTMGKLIVPPIVIILLVVLLFAGMTVNKIINYPLGASVSTTAEYNNTFNDSFSGHIIAKSWWVGSARVTVRNESGEERTLYERWLKVGGA